VWEWSVLGSALIAVMFTYFGWDSATYIASEVRQPGRNLPLAALWGTLAVMAIYLLLNLIFLRAVPIEQASGSVVVADLAARRIFGPVASRAVTLAIIISILGGLNGMILTGPRIAYAMARDGVFFRLAGNVHARHGTPSSAIWIQAGWSVLLALTGTFEALFTATGFVITILAGLTAVGVLVLRRKHPDVPRPYHAWGAPATPLVFALAALWIGISSAIENPVYSLGGAIVIASAWPAYRLWRRSAGKGGG
jgi:APA family basic amino acid/polyamine antiporter